MLCGSCRTAILSRSFLQSNQAITALPSFTLRWKGAEASSWQVPMTWSSACDCAGDMFSLCPQCCSSALAFGGWIHLLNPASLLTRESIGSERSCMRRKVRPLTKWHGQNLSPNAWGTAGAPVWPWMKTLPCSDQAAWGDAWIISLASPRQWTVCLPIAQPGCDHFQSPLAWARPAFLVPCFQWIICDISGLQHLLCFLLHCCNSLFHQCILPQKRCWEE